MFPLLEAQTVSKCMHLHYWPLEEKRLAESYLPSPHLARPRVL